MTLPLTKTRVVEAVADLYLIKLAADPVQHLLQNVDVARATIEKLDEQYQAQVDRLWVQAGQDALNHLNIVMQNNPSKSVSEILARPDVQQSLSLPFQYASTATQQLIQAAWDDGEAVGVQQATSDLSVLGISDSSPDPVVDSSSYLNDVLMDVQANAAAALDRLTKAIQSAPKGQIAVALTQAVNDLSRRSQASIDVSVSRAATEAKIEKYHAAAEASGQQVRLLWVTRFRPTTCPTCAALHGRVVPLGGSFSNTATYEGKAPKVYGDLDGPPRHPNCGCLIVAYVDGAGPTTPETMKLFSQNWWDQNKDNE